ncbi:MAG: glycosyltransferase [Treponema sp.]|jgi:glycosyltransferase involved in cell wall biosynthesis|nr:glycosyltransferase [Treponema sp.]
MTVTLLHYHLRPGGVTQVMLNQARALLESGAEVFVLSGEAPACADRWRGIGTGVIPALRYDRYRGGGGKAPALAAEIARAIRGRFGARAGGPSLLHVHNPLIKKNSLLIGALKLLSADFPLLLHNHDLAEDFRPDVYLNEEYPADCHYAVINSRDYRFMLESGLRAEGLHLLPNEVQTLSAAPGLARNRYLYPVRGIRRKNLGEALLLSGFIPEGRTVAVTQPPTTGHDAAVYGRWKKLAAELDLPVEFEIGERLSFSEALGSAFAVITTSIKEGFGFSFLESWTAGIASTGRRIDYVCRDFEENGVRFDSLYGGLEIPAAWAPPDLFVRRLGETLNAVYAAFGNSLPREKIAAVEKLPDGAGGLDFGVLDEEMQEAVLRSVRADPRARRDIAAANPFLAGLADWIPDPLTIEANRQAVRSAYSREKIGGRLRAIYAAVLAGPVTQSISRALLLERYLDPLRVFLTGIAQ